MREEEERSLNMGIERLEGEVRELRLRIEALAGSAPTVAPRSPEAVPEPAKAAASPAPESVPREAADTLRNLQQMSLSGVWLLYSILLVAYGMWRRLQPVRIVAIALFGFTILKIFIHDLSFLEALYRIVSFLGLGVILLAVSYLYQRYKTVIFESAPPPET